MLTVINADAYHFLGFLRPDRNSCFLVAHASLKERRLNFEVVTKKLIHDEVKILG